MNSVDRKEISMNFMITYDADEMLLYFKGYYEDGEPDFDREPCEARRYYRYEDALAEMKQNSYLGSPDYWVQPTETFFENPEVPIEAKSAWSDLHPTRDLFSREIQPIANYRLDSQLSRDLDIETNDCQLRVFARRFSIINPCFLANAYGLSCKTAFHLKKDLIESLKDNGRLEMLVFDFNHKYFRSVRVATAFEIRQMVADGKAPLHEIAPAPTDHSISESKSSQSFYIFDALWFTKCAEDLE